jgi:ABC transporter substrate binding protein (PQQ-dependent alcohol dehydrogenase system)
MLLMRGLTAACIAAFAISTGMPAQAETQLVRAAVLRVDQGNPLPISRLDLPPADMGFAGARLANDDNQTTGRFMGQTFEVAEVDATPETAVAELERLIGEGIGFIVTMADGDKTVELADAAGDRALILNAGSPDDRLRNELCRYNTLHISPSRAMIADALAQFLMWKKWDEWFLIEGSHPGDRAMAEAYRRAAKKFGAKIVEERLYEDTGGARRTDTGHVQVQKQMPVFTQRAEDHDVIVAADENDVFAAYLPYQTWDPRPIAGSAGLKPVSWHPAQEAWGATQFQRRFERLAGRHMRPEDFQVWSAIRVLGEAATRTRSTDFQTLKDYILSPEFELAAFKGQKLTFRPWNHQLRQPITLTHDKVLVSVSPQTEYLHQVSRLDTIGFDEPESICQFN